MKRHPILTTIACGLLGLGGAAGGVDAAEPARTLRFLTWEDYADPEVIAEFEESHHARIEFLYYETDEERDEILVRSQGRGYDVILVSDDVVERYQSRGWLLGLDASSIPNLSHIDPRWRITQSDGFDYGVAYAWGTSGIGYRSDLTAAPLTRWMDLLRPAPELQGKVLMVADSWELVGIALAALGYDFNSADTKELEAAEDLLLSQRPYVSRYGYPSLTEKSSLISGETVAAPMYSGDALMLAEVDPRIAYVVPEEGTFLWCDYLTVAASSTKSELAKEFLDFLQAPGSAARTAQYLYYPSPNLAATKRLPAEFLADPNVNPPAEILAKAKPYEQMAPMAERKRSSIYLNVVGNLVTP